MSRDTSGDEMGELFDVVVRLNQHFEDQDFRADHGGVDDVRLAQVIDKLNPNLPLTFLELRAVLLAFPRKESWSGKSLRMLYAQARATDKEPSEKLHVKRRRATVEQLDELQRELQYQTSRANGLAEEVTDLRRENQELRAEIQRLGGR